MGEYEVIEHTADVGLMARAADLEELFEVATQGMASIAGVLRPGQGEPTRVQVDAGDLEALLVDWLNEVLYVHDSRASAIRRVSVKRVEDGEVVGVLELSPLETDDDEGVQIKAVTLHQIYVRKAPGGWEARVFFDI